MDITKLKSNSGHDIEGITNWLDILRSPHQKNYIPSKDLVINFVDTLHYLYKASSAKGLMANISLSNLRKNTSRIRLDDGRQVYLMDVIGKYFYAVQEKGYKKNVIEYDEETNEIKKVTTIKRLSTLLFKYKINELPDDYDDYSNEQKIKLLYGDDFFELEDKDLTATPVDIKSATNFCAHQMNYAKKHKENGNHNALKKIDEYLNHAMLITEAIDAINLKDEYGRDLLVQRKKESKFGRTYHNRINLQSVPTIVREAFLGRCAKIDVENAVWAWRYQLATELDPSIQLTCIDYYLNNKKEVRSYLTKHLDELAVTEDMKLKIIKQALTALSFGGRGTHGASKFMVDGKWTQPSLNKIIMNKQARSSFLNDEFVKEIINEINKSTKLILEHFEDMDDLTPSQQMAYHFQHFERKILTEMERIAGDQLLLSVHDCVYVNRAHANDIYRSINYQLKGSAFKVDIEYIDKWGPVAIENKEEDTFIEDVWNKKGLGTRPISAGYGMSQEQLVRQNCIEFMETA